MRCVDGLFLCIFIAHFKQLILVSRGMTLGPELWSTDDTWSKLWPTSGKWPELWPTDDTWFKLWPTSGTWPELWRLVTHALSCGPLVTYCDTWPELWPTGDTKPKLWPTDHTRPELWPTDGDIQPSEVWPTDDTWPELGLTHCPSHGLMMTHSLSLILL